MTTDSLRPPLNSASERIDSTPCEQAWTEETDSRIQTLYMQLQSGNSMVLSRYINVDMPNGDTNVVEESEVAAYDNGQMRYVLRVMLDTDVYRVLWGGKDSPPSVQKKQTDGKYSPASNDEAHVARSLVLQSADFLLESTD